MLKFDSLDLTRIMLPRFYTTLLIALVLGSCSRPDNSFRDQFRWVAGKWVGKDGETTVIEHWKWSKYRYEGEAYRVYDGDTTTREVMFIESFGDKTAYVVIVNGKGPYSFLHTSHEKGQHRFVNRDHDFPSGISYEIKGDSALVIDLAGKSPSTAPSVSYVLKRQ